MFKHFYAAIALALTLTLGGCHSYRLDSSQEKDECVSYSLYEPHVHVVSINLRCRGLRILTTPQSDLGETTSTFFNRSGAHVAINGSFHKRGHRLIGLNVSNGIVLNAALHDRDYSFLACTSDNKCEIGRMSDSTDVTGWQHVVAGWQPYIAGAFVCFNPADESCKISNGARTHPRTAVGLDASRERLFFVVVEGRLPEFPGMTLDQLSRVFRKLNITEGLNLDGGGSSTMVLGGRRVNALPSNQGVERKVANHLGIRVE